MYKQKQVFEFMNGTEKAFQLNVGLFCRIHLYYINHVSFYVVDMTSKLRIE